VSAPIALSLFDFVDEFAAEVKIGSIEGLDPVEEDSSLLIDFCETFFVQFFGPLGCNIRSFDAVSKRQASELVERLRLQEGDTQHTRVIITLFESFCDMYEDIADGSYGSWSVTYEEFHTDYMSRLLEGAQEWANVEGFKELADRITDACYAYNVTITAKGW
jgi:hypothetical protein